MSSPFQKMFTTKTPFHQGGYVGGGDIAGAQYVPTGSMYANMFAKIGQAIADIDANKKKKEDAKNLPDIYAKWKKNNPGASVEEFRKKYKQEIDIYSKSGKKTQEGEQWVYGPNG